VKLRTPLSKHSADMSVSDQFELNMPVAHWHAKLIHYLRRTLQKSYPMCQWAVVIFRLHHTSDTARVNLAMDVLDGRL
jgi:hypothetical protein